MKKILLISALSTLTYFAQAQLHPDIGIKGGLNVSNLKIENTSSPDSKLGIHLGALCHLHFSENWAIQPEIMYSSQGAEQTISGVDYKVKLHYVNIPVLFQYMTGSGFRIQTGPQLGILAGAKTKAGDTESDAKDVYDTFDFDWALGASYVTNSGFGIDARYNWGLANILDDKEDPFVKNRVLQVGVFYQFRVSQMGHKHIK